MRGAGFSLPRRHSCRRLGPVTAFALAATCLAQQRLDIHVPNPNPTVGEEMQLRAILRTAQGASSDVTSQATWASSSPAIQMTSPGLARASHLSRALITARMGNMQSTVAVTILPSRIEVKPDYAEVRVGEQLQLQATAYDVNGEPVPHTFDAWELTGANGGQINAAGIATTGLLEARAAGRITVRAVVRYGADPVQRVWGVATVVIHPPRDYRLRRVMSSDMVRHSFQVRPVNAGSMRANDAGQLVVPACLDGLVCGLLLLDNGRIDLLAPGGQTTVGGFFGNSWALTDTPAYAAINAGGQVLFQRWAHPGDDALSVATRERTTPLVFGRGSVGDFTNVFGFRLSRDSFNDNGEAVMQAGSGPAQLLLRYIGRSVELVAASTSPLSGFPAPWFLSEYGIDNNASVYFTVQGAFVPNTPVRSGLYRKEGFAPPARILGPGDAFAGGTIQSIWTMAVDRASGSVAFGAQLEDGRQFYVRDIRGVRSMVAVQGAGPIYSAGAAGVLVFANGTRGNGLYVWKGEALTPLLVIGTLLDTGEPVQQIHAAHLTASGRLYAQVRTPSNPLVILGPDNRTLLAAGSRVDLTSGFQFSALSGSQSMLMASPEPGRVLLRFAGSNIFELDADGLTPKLLAGDIVGENAIIGGPAIATRSGALYFVPSDGSLYRWRNGAVELVTAAGAALADGIVANRFELLAANDSAGAVLLAYGNVDRWLVVASPGAPLRTLARSGTPSPTGGTLNNWRMAEIDDSGRVMAAIDSGRQNNPSDLVLYSDGKAEPLVIAGQSRIGGMLVGTVAGLRASGGRFYAGLQETTPCCVTQLAEYSDGRWNLIAIPGDRMPDGATMRSAGIFDVNARGEAMLTAQAQSGFSTLMTVDAAGATRFVQSDYLPTSDGDVIAQMNSVLFNDDGSGWLSAFDARGRFVIYAVEPVRR